MNLIVADHTLQNYMGHSFEYARSVGAEAKEQGLPVTTLAHREVAQEVVEDIGALPCFRFDNFHCFHPSRFFSFLPADLHCWLTDEWNFRGHAQAICADLHAIEDRIDLKNSTVMLFPTMGFNDVVPVVKWAEGLPVDRRPWIGLVFHFTGFPNYSRAYPRPHYYSRAFSRLEKSPVRDRFRLFTDSNMLAEEYVEYTSLPFKILPIPHAIPEQARKRSNQEREPGSPIRLTYLGDARVNKGFHLLPSLFNGLEALIRKGLVQGEIQANVRNPEEWETVLALRRLRQIPGVRLYEEAMSSEGYYNLVDRADIVLIPYTLENYHSQTSGIFAEALAHGKPVVVPRGSWMAQELKEEGAGVTFLPEDRQSLLETCREALGNFSELRIKAQEKATKWRSQHSTARYLRLILESFTEEPNQ